MVSRAVCVRGPVYEHLFAPYAEGRWDDFPREQLFEGAAGTGKSMGIGLFLDAVARDWPGCRILVIRKTRVSLSQSWMVTFEEKVLRRNDPMRHGASRSHRQSYVYANGAEIVLGGMDNPTRTFSTEYDIIYVNEATEFTEEEVEQLHRALRNGVLPFQCMILDCNPDSEFHWLNVRCNDTEDSPARTVRRVTKLWHNPGYWDGNGWTRQGRAYRDGLMATMTGVRFDRLVRGLWVTAEGTIIPIDKGRHVLQGRVEFPPHRRPRIVLDGQEGHVEVRFFYGAVDWGFRNPGTLQVWAVDDNKRSYLVHELYQSEKGEDWWAEQVVELDEKYLFKRVVCDHAEPGKIEKFNRVLREARDRRGLEWSAVAIPAVKAGKATKSWLEVQAALMRRQFSADASGVPRAFLLADSLKGERDPNLGGKPQCFLHEAVGWTYEKYDSSKHRGMPKEIGDQDKANHAIDAASYGFEWLETHDLPDDIEDRWAPHDVDPDSWAALEPHLKWI